MEEGRCLVVSLLYLLFRRVLAVAALRLRSREFKELEIVVLRHELAVLRRQVARPRLGERDRLFLAAASRLLSRASQPSFFIRPDTLLGWHRQLVRKRWTYAGRRPGRPRRALDRHHPPRLPRLAPDRKPQTARTRPARLRRALQHAQAAPRARPETTHTGSSPTPRRRESAWPDPATRTPGWADPRIRPSSMTHGFAYLTRPALDCELVPRYRPRSRAGGGSGRAQ
jgi:putative transposase